MDARAVDSQPTEIVPTAPPLGNDRAWRAFLRNLLLSRPAWRRSPGLNGLAARLGIGVIDAQNPAFVRYEAHHFELAEQLLQGAGHLAAQEAKRPPSSSPSERRLEDGKDLVALVRLGDMPEGVRLLGVTYGTASQMPHEVLVVCQHLQGLQRLRSYAWMDRLLGGRRALVLFRGGSAGFSRLASDEVLEATTSPVLALYDCNASGLAAASRLPRLQDVCLPPEAALGRLLAARRHASSYPEGLRQHAAHLDACSHPGITRAWAWVKQEGRGALEETFPNEVD